MAGALGLGSQIGLTVLTAWKGVGHTLHDFDPRGMQRAHLVGIVGEKTDAIEAQRPEHFCSNPIETFFGLEAQPLICHQRVKTLILQAVGTQFVDEANAAPLLREIKKNAATLIRSDRRDRSAQLISTV